MPKDEPQFVPYLCDRCHDPLPGGGLCSVCRRQLARASHRIQRVRYDDEMTPIQEYAVRLLEDQQ